MARGAQRVWLAIIPLLLLVWAGSMRHTSHFFVVLSAPLASQSAPVAAQQLGEPESLPNGTRHELIGAPQSNTIRLTGSLIAGLAKVLPFPCALKSGCGAKPSPASEPHGDTSLPSADETSAGEAGPMRVSGWAEETVPSQGNIPSLVRGVSPDEGVTGTVETDAAVTAVTNPGKPLPTNIAGTLVIYLYGDTDPNYRRNFEFFLEHGMESAGGLVDYVIIVQQDSVEEAPQLPSLPRHARYVHHNNSCYDWGTYGWALEAEIVDTSVYAYIVLINSSVRGPFLPPYWPASLHWTTAFTSRIRGSVKLVGPSISCGATFKGTPGASQIRNNPHVQSFVLATDQVGLQVLRADPDIFRCHTSLKDTIWHSELGASAAILEAGWNLDSLMLKFQGIDWRQRSAWGCNRGANPLLNGRYDGISLHPFEVMFVKVKSMCLIGSRQCSDAAEAAITYDRFLSHQGELDTVLAHQEPPKKPAAHKQAPLVKLEHVGDWTLAEACLDVASYRSDHGDLSSLDHWQAVSHFLANGQKENRNIRLRSDAENCRIELINKGGDDSVVTARLHMGAVLEQLVHEEWAAEGRQTSG